MANTPWITLVEPASKQPAAPCEIIRDSHPSPRFSEVAVKLLSLRVSEEGNRLLAKLHLSGTVRSSACDLIPGDQATIREVIPEVNGVRCAAIPTSVTKASVWHSLEEPYPMSASFAAEVDEVDVSTGSNGVELMAVDPVPGFGLTGFISFVLRIDIESSETNADVQKGPITRHPAGQFVFLAWEPRSDSRSLGGEIHVYYARLDGERDLVSSLRREHAAHVALGPDNQHYLTGPDGRPEPIVLVAAAEASPARRMLASGSGTFESGFLEGFVYRRAAFLRGSVELEQTTLPGQPRAIEVLSRHPLAQAGAIRRRELGRLGSRVSDFSAAVQAVYDFVQAANGRQYDFICEVVAGNSERFNAPSKELVLLCLYVRGLLEEAQSELAPGAVPAKLGEIQGRICRETLACLIAERKLGATCREKVLSRLRATNVLGAENSSLIDRVLSMWKSLPLFR